MTDHGEQRRAPRKPVDTGITVVDVIRDQPLGHLGNLSATGMLLIGPLSPQRDAVYQVRLPLPGKDGSAIEVGIQTQWSEPATRPGLNWTGYRIIAIARPDTARLDRWLRQA